MIKSIKDLVVVDLIDLKQEMIRDGIPAHLVQADSDKFFANGRHNDAGYKYWIEEEEGQMPTIDKYLVDHGFKYGQQIMFYVCW